MSDNTGATARQSDQELRALRLGLPANATEQQINAALRSRSRGESANSRAEAQRQGSRFRERVRSSASTSRQAGSASAVSSDASPTDRLTGQTGATFGRPATELQPVNSSLGRTQRTVGGPAARSVGSVLGAEGPVRDVGVVPDDGGIVRR